MTSGAPWSVKGIDPKVREVAKDMARRAGLTLGEWLNQVILDDGASGEDSLADFRGGASRSFGGAALGAASLYGRFEAPQHPGDELFRVTEALDRLSARIEAAEHRSTLAINGIDQSVAGLVARLDGTEREQTAVAARFEGAVDDLRTEHGRLAERMRRVDDEMSGPRSLEAIRTMEAAMAKVASHVYEGEARTAETIQQLRTDLDGVAGRLSEIAAPAGADHVDGLVADIAQRLESAEQRTTAAVRGLEESLAKLDERIGGVETQVDGKVSQTGLEQLAANLSARVDEARQELAEKIRAAADGRFDGVEERLNEMTGHVQAAERRSASAIERMGHEVLRMADVLNRKVQDAEQRSAAAVETVSGEVARIATVVENRLDRTDASSAQALEKLGGEIARISERLAERISDAERRSAQAIDDVGEQMSRFTDRVADRQDRASNELADRIRQSEERTARLLEDARERLDRRLAEQQQRFAPPTPPAALEPPPEPMVVFIDPEPDVAPFGHVDLDASAAPEAPAPEFAPSPNFVRDFLQPAPGRLGASRAIAETAEYAEAFDVVEAFDVDDVEIQESHETRHAREPQDTFEPQDAFKPQDAFEPQDTFETQDDLEPADHLETSDGPGPDEAFPASRDFSRLAFAPQAFAQPAFTAAPIETSPAADEAMDLEAHVSADVEPRFSDVAGVSPDDFRLPPLPDDFREAAADFDEDDVDVEEAVVARAPTPSPARALIEQARAAARASAEGGSSIAGDKAPRRKGSLFSSFGADKVGRNKPSTLQMALVTSGAVAATSLAAAGYILLADRPAGRLPARVADAIASSKPATPPAREETPALAAMALSPKPIIEASPVSTDPTVQQAAAAPAMGSAELYADGLQRLDAHDPVGLANMRKSANLGYAPAEFFLAKLYETGGSGVKKDMDEARRWTERAAQAGDRKAMHNLALYYFEGSGGEEKNTTLAAQWFRRAAESGLVDSQYNLARLYEEGFGVAQNPAEAYKWYLIAGAAGDQESRNSAKRLKAALSPEAGADAERAAESFQAQATRPADPAALAANTADGDVAGAQRALARLGYYRGPTDGQTSSALKFAIAAFQRDKNLPVTGELDASIAPLLSAVR